MKDEFALLEYPDATIETMGAMVPVKLKLSDQGILYRNIKTGKQDQLSPSDIEVVNWQRLGGGYGVRIFTSDGSLYRFGGFKEIEQPKLEKFFKNTFDKTMTEREYSVKGWNYGAVKFKGASLSFEVSSLPAFEIPVTNVCGCVTGKNEVTLEFHQHDDSAVSLNEMRFHIPSSELSADDPVESFQQKVMAKASIITATGDALAIFTQVQCLTPRGRYDMKIYPSFIQLHGKTFDFKLPISTIIRLFLLPHYDGRQHFFVVSLDPPIKQGQTRYPYLITSFVNDETELVELALSDEEIKSKYDGRLEKEMNGPQYEVISRMFKGICQKKIVTPGNFVGHSGSPAISCSYKAVSGYLYPLERGFIFVHKPPVHIRFDELSAINFARSGSTTRSFDFEVELRNGVLHTFSSIEKGEYNKLYEFVTSKKLRIKNKSKMDSVSHKDAFSDSDSNEPDPYINRVRAEGQERFNDDEESEEDSDFNPDAGEGSDVAEEYDSNPSTSDESGSDEDSPKKEKKSHKPKKAKTVSEKPRKKRQKKEKDENRPKRPQTAYFLWLNDNREKIKSENPGISITEISKKAGQLWKEIKEKDKAEYDKRAAKGKKEYEAAMAEYKASGGAANKKSSPNKSSKKVTKVTVSPSKAGSGSGFKSKEYIDEDSSSTDSDEKPLKKLKKEKKDSKEKKKKNQESEEEKSEEQNQTSEEEEEEEEGSESGDSD